MIDLESRVHALSTEMPTRDVGGRGEELASEVLADELYNLGLQTDIDGFTCPGNLWLSRTVYFLLVFLAGLITFAAPSLRGLGLVLGIAGVVLLYFSYCKADFLGSIITKFDSQNVVARYVPQGASDGARRSKVIITAHYDVKKPSLFQMPMIRRFWPIIRKVIIGAVALVPVCALLALLPFPEILQTIFGVIALLTGVVALLKMVDEVTSQFFKTPKGANSNASGLAVMHALAEKLATADVRPVENSYAYDEYGDEGYYDAEESIDFFGDETHAFKLADNITDDIDSEKHMDVESEARAVSAPSDATAAWSADNVELQLSENIQANPQNREEVSGAATPVPEAQPKEQVVVASFNTRSGKVMQRAAAPKPAEAPAGDAAVAAAAVTNAEMARAQQLQQEAKRVEKKKPSWWSKVEDEKERGEIGPDEQELTLRSRFADSPASRFADTTSVQQNVQSVEEVGAEAAQPTEAEQPVEVAAEVAKTEVSKSMPAEGSMQAAPTEAASSKDASAEPGLAVEFGASRTADDGVEVKDAVISLEAEGAKQPQIAAPAQPQAFQPEPLEVPAMSAELAQEPQFMSQIDAEPSNADAEAEVAVAASSPVVMPQEPQEPQDVSANDSAYNPRPAKEVIASVEQSMKEAEEQKAAAEVARAGAMKRQPYEEELVQPEQQPDWPTGAYKYTRDHNRYVSEQGSSESYDSISEPQQAPSFSRAAYSTAGAPEGESKIEMESTQAWSAEEVASASRVMDYDPQTHRRIQEIEPESSQNNESTQLLDAVSELLGDTPASNNQEFSLEQAPAQQGISMGMNEYESSSVLADSPSFGDEPLQTGSFAPLYASGVMQPVTTQMLEEYNAGKELYVDDAGESYEQIAAYDNASMGSVSLEMPGKRRGLFGGKDNKKKGKKRRGKKGEDAISANEWLGVDSNYNATQEGARIGSWDNFDDDDSWDGGAYGGSSMQSNRDAIAVLSDELLNKEVWFVALGASGADSFGMQNFVKTHASDVRHAKIINLESIGAGQLFFTKSEPVLFSQKHTDGRMQKLVSKSARAAKVHIEPVNMIGHSTDALKAMDNRVRSITITALKEGITPGWRWSDDTEDLVSLRNMEDVEKIMVELIKNA